MAYFTIGAITVNDVEGYEPYMTGGFASLQIDGAEALAYGAPEMIEGNAPGERLVLIKFRDKATFEAWYQSPAYQGIISIRHATADTAFLLGMEGLA